MTEKENVFEIESSELKCSINAITTNREETERERDDVLFFSKVGTQKTENDGRKRIVQKSKIDSPTPNARESIQTNIIKTYPFATPHRERAAQSVSSK